METITYSHFRRHLAHTSDQMNNDHKLADVQVCQETLYLMASPNNAERLNEAIAKVEAGNIHRLLDDQ